MKSWKVLLGIGGACAACCALPVGAWLAALVAASAGAAAWWVDATFLAGGLLLVLALAAAGAWWKRRGRLPDAPAQAPRSACGCPADRRCA